MNRVGTLLCASTFALAGCTVVERPEPADAYVYTEPVPDDVYVVYPTTVYEGRTYVWYRERWIYRHGDRWVYVHDEPVELHRRRPVVQTAAPAYRPSYHGYGGGPPPLPAPR